MTIKQLVAFAILMENNGGIVDKAPIYIEEKIEMCSNCPDDLLYTLLDSNNQSKFEIWCNRWLKPKAKYFDPMKADDPKENEEEIK